MIYIALIIAIVLACVAGLQHFYLMFLEARSRQERRRIADLERANAELRREMQEAETLLAEQERQFSGDAWPELIDEGGDWPVR